MSTDQMIEEETREGLSFETMPKGILPFGAQIPSVPPYPRVKRASGISGRLKARLLKAKNFLSSISFARQLTGFMMTSKALQKSAKLHRGVSTRAARQAIKAARQKKHRARS